jgi:hypothetical protein
MRGAIVQDQMQAANAPAPDALHAGHWRPPAFLLHAAGKRSSDL